MRVALTLTIVAIANPVLIGMRPAGVVLGADCSMGAAPSVADDCNHNRILDACEIVEDSSVDCDLNGVLDECELSVADCNNDGRVDACEIAAGTAADCNDDRFPDECESTPRFRAFESESVDVDGVDISTVDDLNGDGEADLIASTRSGMVVFWGHSEGRFGSTTRIPVVSRFSVTVDFDGDDRQDLILFQPAVRTTRAILMRQSAARTFEKVVEIQLTFRAISAVAADFNEDTVVDLAVGARGALWILPGAGGGRFLSPQRAAAHGGWLTAADMDNDQLPDLIAIEHGFGTVFANRVGFDFAPAGELDLVIGYGVEIADLNGDSWLDVVTGDGLVFLRTGESTYTNVDHLRPGLMLGRFPMESNSSSVALGDVNGDGTEDAILIRDTFVTIWANDGAARFTLLQRLNVATEVPSDLDACDLNGDGLVDLAVTLPKAGTVAFLMGSPRSAAFGRDVYPHFLDTETPQYWPVAAMAGDLDADGDRDAFVVPDRQRLQVYENRGAAGLERVFDGESAVEIATARTGDLDADGRADLIVQSSSRDMIAFVSTGRFEYSQQQSFTLPGWMLHVLDLNLDGRDDFVIRPDARDSSLVVLTHRGQGEFEELYAADFSFHPLFVEKIQLDGDRFLDLVVGGAKLAFLRNDGREVALAVDSSPVGGSLRDLRVGDFDHDGKDDVVLDRSFSRDNTTIGATSVLFQREGYEFVEGAVYEDPFVASSIAIGDFDSDGDIDVARASTERFDYDVQVLGSELVVLVNDGTGALTESKSRVVGDFPLWVDSLGLDGAGTGAVMVAAGSSLSVLRFLSSPLSLDSDADGTLDRCQEGAFQRGDANDDGRHNIADPIRILRVLFAGEGFACARAVDVDDNGAINFDDALALLSYLFQSGPVPAAPFDHCGLDTTPDGLACSTFSSCR